MQYEKILESVLREIIARWGIPGLAVGIVEGEEILFARGCGVQSLSTGTPVTPESIFCVASISKPFVATAVVQLAEQGKIDLDAPLVQTLPYFRLDGAGWEKITPRQILSHTSGLPDMDESEYDDLVAHPEYDDGAAERLTRSLSSREMAAAPGERFLYSNLGYDVLGDLITKTSGQTFETYLKEQVLLPAGMADSTFLPHEVERSRLAVPHLRMPEMRVNPIYPYHRADAPASFLHSTVVDMCHWASTWLNLGIHCGQRLITPAGVEMMWTPVAGRGAPPLYEEMGLGWVLGHIEGLKTASHGGMGFGWTAFLTLLPDKKRAGVILCNEESHARSRIIRAVLQVLLDQEPKVGTVSWMVPISQALQQGGIQAANAWVAEFKKSDTQKFSMHEDDLVNLMIQLRSVKKIDLAIAVLQLNLSAFPRSLDSQLGLADLYLRKGERARAETCLLEALAIQPDYFPALELLDRVRLRENQ